VYWVIFRRPDSPSFLSASSDGTTTDINCMMMDADPLHLVVHGKVRFGSVTAKHPFGTTIRKMFGS